MRTNLVLSAGLLATFSVSGCQCVLDENFQQLKDAGFEEPDAGPPPPVFPLKAGDILTIPQFGARTSECEGGGAAGDCDRNIKATYQITAVALDEDQRWDITADVLYEGLAEKIPAAAMSRLALSNGADFASVTIADASSVRDAIFTTDTAPALSAETYKPNNFPFFQAANDINDGDNGEVFAEGAQSFTEQIVAIDAEAEIETQVAAGKMEAYFRDDVGGEVSLHKLQASFHPMGFVCGWDEILIPFVDGTTARSQASFQGIENPPLTASFFQPNLVRDGVTYQCSCFSRTCRAGTNCLDPSDPDATPSAEACQ